MDLLQAINDAGRDTQAITMAGKPYVALPEAAWAAIRQAADWEEDQMDAACERQEARQGDEFVNWHESMMAAR